MALKWKRAQKHRVIRVLVDDPDRGWYSVIHAQIVRLGGNAYRIEFRPNVWEEHRHDPITLENSTLAEAKAVGMMFVRMHQ